jgi:hypothetical protein
MHQAQIDMYHLRWVQQNPLLLLISCHLLVRVSVQVLVVESVRV